ncbi:MAG TPA: hypothetical protein VLB72_05000 [Burkholderiales bacterium]|nr:hypothetical protein [Burkholderiales bacterium]
MAIKWTGGGAEHPMANPVQARQVVAELPDQDATMALEKITEWLESLNQADGLKVDRRYECIDLLDGAARRHQQALTQEYLSTPRVQKFQENRLWNAAFGYYKELGEAYVRCIKECVGGFQGASAAERVLPAIVARALRALAMQLKWTLLRYGLVERRIWTHLAMLYRFAKEKDLSEKVIAVYPVPHPATTVKREFLKALMLPASSLDGLTPVAQQIAERTVVHFAESFLLSTEAKGCTHSFDLAAPRPPARLVPAAAESGLLYFGAGKALAELDRLTEQVAARGGVTHDYGLGTNCHKDDVLPVLRHLAQYWSDTPPARNSERRPTAARLTVVPGADQVFRMLNPSATVSTGDFSGNPTAESWIVENVSDSGCGAIVPPQKIDWVKVGTLIGMKSEISGYLGVGVIRRITRDAHQQRRVGIQVLTKTAIPITISKASTMSALNFDLREETAILLTVKPDARGEIEVLLLREGIFNGRDSLEMTLQRKNYRLEPLRTLEAGDDFYWARFKVTQQVE